MATKAPTFDQMPDTKIEIEYDAPVAFLYCTTDRVHCGVLCT